MILLKRHFQWLTGAIAGTLFATTAAAQQAVIDANTTGNWYNPEQSGHGLQIEVLDLNRAVVAWFTFDNDGNPMWLFGLGSHSDTTLIVDLERFEGPRFPPFFDSGDLQREPWGHIEFELLDCNEAHLEWMPEVPGFSPGEMPLRRLTAVDGARCGEQAEFDRTITFLLDRGPLDFEAPFLLREGQVLEFEHESIPPPLSNRRGLMISGPNGPAGGPLMLMTPLTGLEPETTYKLELEIQFATAIPSGCFGLGSEPDGNMFLAAADRRVEDGDSLSELDFFRVGDLTTPIVCNERPSPLPWFLKRLSTSGQRLEATTDADGTLWVFAFSGNAAITNVTWYLTEFIVRLAEDPQDS